MNKPKRAYGMQGTLLRGFDGEYSFRTYDNNGKFTDHKLVHNDLQIEILDKDAYLWDNGKSDYDGVLDHSPATLGHYDLLEEDE